MTAFKLGKVAITPRGEYDPGVDYERLDAVSYNGSSFLVLQTVSGVTPEEGEYYTLLAEKGERGQKGSSVRGPEGPQGPQGETGLAGLSIYHSFAAPEQNPDEQWVFIDGNITLPEGRSINVGDLIICTTNGNLYYVLDISTASEIPVELVGNIMGAQGPQGEKGDKGDKGETGGTGATGPQGPAGADGATSAEVIAAMTKETWTFTLADGTTVDKVVPLV